jgi:hypothetical protein
MQPPDYEQNVFINCPFDAEYQPIFEALVFAIHDLGFRPRSALERLDSGELRLEKLAALIEQSRFSVHDLSRTSLDGTSLLPRFNMPLELGIDWGCRRYSSRHKNKAILIFDSQRYRHQRFVSDLAGCDIQQHNSDPDVAIIALRHWLRAASGDTLPAGSSVKERYRQFRLDLPSICDDLHFDAMDLPFIDFSFTVTAWLRLHPFPP